MRMYELFIKTDALLIEVNPYAYEGEDKCKLCLFTLTYFQITSLISKKIIITFSLIVIFIECISCLLLPPGTSSPGGFN